VVAPSTGHIAPPGYYMLFVLNSAGVPSVATFVRLSASPVSNQPPTAIINSPSAEATVVAGGSVSFAGAGTDPDGSISAYAWAFPGGSPSSSSVAAPGNVVYSTAGKYVASFTVTDNGGVQSQAVTRAVTVTDFSLSATPGSQTVVPGSSGSYTVSTTPQNGFSGNITFGVTGLPSGATASFTPASVGVGQSTTLSVTTSTTIAPGSYPLTITANSGPLSHSVGVTLIVPGDFSIAVPPPSTATISKGGSAAYGISVTAGQGFSGTVAFSISGLPKFATAKFSPTTVVNSGTSKLTVSTNKNVSAGTATLTVTGTSVGRVRSTAVTLVIQ
jgi:PKD domain/Domain of unknown function (DUF1929)